MKLIEFIKNRWIELGMLTLIFMVSFIASYAITPDMGARNNKQWEVLETEAGVYVIETTESGTKRIYSTKMIKGTDNAK